MMWYLCCLLVFLKDFHSILSWLCHVVSYFLILVGLWNLNSNFGKEKSDWTSNDIVIDNSLSLSFFHGMIIRLLYQSYFFVISMIKIYQV